MTAAADLATSALIRPRIRTVIVNADDFGRSRGINRGVLEAYDSGIVTSASFMTMWPASSDAAKQALERPALSVGLHVDLGEWVYRKDAWKPRYVRAALDDGCAIAAEVERQLRVFRRLLNADPTHLDSHQHVHLRPPVWSILCELADTLDVPLRHRGGLVRYCGAFYGLSRPGEPAPDRLTPSALRTTLAGLGDGLTELVCHPGYAVDVATSYAREREIEVQTLCDESVGAVFAEEGIFLGSFRGLPSSNGVGRVRTVREPLSTDPAPPRRVESVVERSASGSAGNEFQAISPELARAIDASEAAPFHRWPALGALLIHDGLMSERDLEAVLFRQRISGQQQISGKWLGELLVTNGLVTPAQVARLLAQQYELPFVELDGSEIHLQPATLLSEELARRFSALPISRFPDNSVLVALADPRSVFFSGDLHRALGATLRFAVAAPEKVDAAITFAYQRAQALTSRSTDTSMGVRVHSEEEDTPS